MLKHINTEYKDQEPLGVECVTDDCLTTNA